MPKQILAWECKYCGAIKRTEKIATRHEKSCTYNPNAQNCMFCLNSYTENNFGEPSKLRCRERKCDCSRAISAECPVFRRKKDEEGPGIE